MSNSGYISLKSKGDVLSGNSISTGPALCMNLGVHYYFPEQAQECRLLSATRRKQSAGSDSNRGVTSQQICG